MPQDLREHLVRSLEADLVGPFDLDPASAETLSIAPLRWYTAGFLAPVEAPDVDPSTQDEGLGAGDDEDDAETGGQEAQPKAPRRLPSSIGLSVLLPKGSASDTVHVLLSFGEYVLGRGAGEGEAKEGAALPPGTEQTWTRKPVGPLPASLPLEQRALETGVEVAPGIWIEGQLGEARAHGLKEGTRALTVFVVNRRPTGEAALLDAACIFQVALELRSEGGLEPRTNRRDEGSGEWDEAVADLAFRARMEWAVGHGVSATPITEKGKVIGARSTWLPTAVVHRVEAREVPGVTTAMRELGALADGAAAKKALEGIVAKYGEWIEEQRGIPLDTQDRKDTRDTLLHRAGIARARIDAGIALLASNAQVLEAFRITNRAMHRAALQRDPGRYEKSAPAWRLFQLAFVVMNLPGIADPSSDDRAVVDLIFFPTGGGKTEAYLGLIAFTLALRRLRGRTRPDQGLGVTILLRYTLRLLTLDQLGRAATLICALEEIRRARPDSLGEERFAIGLWVGRSATANTMSQVTEALMLYGSKRGPSPFPLPQCPWCKRDLEPGCFHVEEPERVAVSCPNYECPFSAGNHPDGIPVLFVDESIYRELPCFVVATVDKFAMLPWRGETAKLFGGATSRVGKSFSGPLDGPKAPKGATLLPEGLLPPELIVQDELHLISGPLGTMVGLYETAIEALCSRGSGDARAVPKIVASTATVRRASAQVRSLFGREEMMFPPPGVNETDTFFARTDETGPGRLYLGVAAPGRAMKALLLRTYVALLGAAEKLYDPTGPAEQAADAYMTLVGYFNSLRELGGMRRLVEADVRNRCLEETPKRTPPGYTGEHPWARKRVIKYEPVELTSRRTTAEIAQAKSQLGLPYPHADHIDVVLASNMISVGVDIDRLGLMVVAGQPKTTSEYIQASSRVGRARDRPGLVVTVLNVYKARDRSHYERFTAYHESFYRFVEATSVTPFSAPALDRGLAGVLVSMTRLGNAAMTDRGAVRRIAAMQGAAMQAVERLADKAARERERDEEGSRRVRDEVTRLGTNLIGAWMEVIEKEGVQRYSRFEAGDGIPLLFTALDEDAPQEGTAWAKFRAPTSMRDVEPSVHIWKSKQALSRVGSSGDDE